MGKRNQVTIPVEMLRQLGVQPGESVSLTLTEDKMIRVEKAEDPIAHALGLLHRPGMKPLSDEELEEAIREAQAERATERYLRSWES